MNSQCSLHCGHFTGVAKSVFATNSDYLHRLFTYVFYDEAGETLEVTGAREIDDHPDALRKIFNTLATLLKEGGKGRIMLQCDTTEICFFRRNMWKLMSIQVPPDPFEDIYYVA
jgi:hypothetical protein